MGPIDIEDFDYDDNHSSRSSGVLGYSYNVGKITMKNGRIVNSSAGSVGGAFNNYYTEHFYMENVLFDNNTCFNSRGGTLF